jgi:hypothetical protein
MTETIRALTITPEWDEESGVTTITVADATLTKGDTLAGLQAAVGGSVQCIDVFHPETESRLVIWVNEDGKWGSAQGDPCMSRNVFAEVIATHGGWRGWDWDDFIAGPAILTGLNYAVGETVSIPDEWVIRIVALGMGGE